MKIRSPLHATARRKFLVRGTVVLLACGAALFLLRMREPRYQGRSLSGWLQKYTEASTPDEWDEARNAVCSIDAERCLPTLLKLITAKDGPFEKWVLKVARKIGMGRSGWRDASQCQYLGELGFALLGTNAAPAVDALTKLLNNENTASVAAACLQSIGKPAEGALCQGLTNQDWRIRQLSVTALVGVTDAHTYISRVKDCSNDRNLTVRIVALHAIGARHDAPDLAIPILIQTLNSTNDLVSMWSAEAIGEFGTNGASAFSSLTNLIGSSNLNLASVALQSMVAVAPTRALPIMSNTIVNGHPSLCDTALRILTRIAPKLSAQMALAQLHSPDPLRRLQALNLRNEEARYLTSTWISQYPDAREQFISSLTILLNDPDQDVRTGATNALKELDPQAAAEGQRH